MSKFSGTSITPQVSGVVAHLLQQTVKDAVVAHGVGVHTGAPVQLVIRPAPPGTGVQIRRVDLPEQPVVAARIESVNRTLLATTLSAGKAEVTTVEHLLSALAGVGVDNAFLEVDSFEVPIFDGSAAPIVELILRTGLVFQSAPKQRYKVTQTVQVGDKNAWIRVEPAPAFCIDYTLVYDHPFIGTQQIRYIHSPARYRREISHARTFCLAADIEKMRSLGLARGGSLENAVVVGDAGVVNPGGLRYADEFVRHKVLDLIGDFALLGLELVGKVTAWRSGHTMNRAAVSELLKEKAVFVEEVSIPIYEADVIASVSGIMGTP